MNFDQIKQHAKESVSELKKLGFISAPPFGWLHKDCIDFGLKTGAIIIKGDFYSLVAEMVEEERIAGYRGRTPVVEKISRRDLSRVNAFFSFCDSWQTKHHQQEYVIDEEMRSLIGNLL